MVGCWRWEGDEGHPPMPLTMHMIHPRVSLLTSATSMVGCQGPLALSLTPRSFS